MNCNFRRLILTLLVCSVGFAKGSGSIERGGFGFLFSDNNNFANPGLFGGSKAFAFDAKYDTASGGSVKGITTSAVYGSGLIGIGAYGNRTGTNLSASGAYDDIAGVGMGFGIAKGKVLVGAGYRREVSTQQSNDGRVDATMTMKSGDKGFALGLGATTELNSVNDEVKTATVAVGYAFSNGIGFEIDGVANDMANTKNLLGAAYISKSAQSAFMSVGYLWNNVSSRHGAAARIGFILGKSFDISAYATHTFYTGSSPSYGGSLRFTM